MTDAGGRMVKLQENSFTVLLGEFQQIHHSNRILFPKLHSWRNATMHLGIRLSYWLVSGNAYCITQSLK